MVGADKERVLKQLNVYFETPEAVRRTMVNPVQSLPPDIPGRREYIDGLKEMSLDALKCEMKRFGLKGGSKAMMRQRLEMAWDALHPNSPMLRRLDQHINASQGEQCSQEVVEPLISREDSGGNVNGQSGRNGEDSRGNVNVSDIDEIFNILLS